MVRVNKLKETQQSSAHNPKLTGNTNLETVNLIKVKPAYLRLRRILETGSNAHIQSTEHTTIIRRPEELTSAESQIKQLDRTARVMLRTSNSTKEEVWF